MPIGKHRTLPTTFIAQATAQHIWNNPVSGDKIHGRLFLQLMLKNEGYRGA
jgi:hypothetical protein